MLIYQPCGLELCTRTIPDEFEMSVSMYVPYAMFLMVYLAWLDAQNSHSKQGEGEQFCCIEFVYSLPVVVGNRAYKSRLAVKFGCLRM